MSVKTKGQKKNPLSMIQQCEKSVKPSTLSSLKYITYLLDLIRSRMLVKLVIKI